MEVVMNNEALNHQNMSEPEPQ